VGTCLAVYSIVTLLRAWFAWQAYASGEPYTQPYESFSYLLPYNFAIPALVMGFIGMTLMTMQRILAVSHTHATRAQQSALRFERLLQASSAGVAVLKDGKLLDANGQLELLTGLSRDELLGQTFENLFPKKVKEKLIDIMNLADGRQSDVDLCVGDNCVLPIEIRMMPFSELGGADLVVELRDISHRRALEDELKHMATIDPLTGALNRRSFNDLFELNVKRLTRYPSPMCLAMLDIDHFKAVNDIQGHQAGDEALRQFSALCQSRARATDIFARFGGEEFMLLMPDTNLEGAGIILQRLLEGVADLKIHGASGTFGFHASVGLTDYRSGDTLENLLKRADQALYRAKREGRNRISYEAAELAV
jgi:diguanylate cyclase (GGDEF)-like protein/PAS domain S-box-containing protein